MQMAKKQKTYETRRIWPLGVGDLEDPDAYVRRADGVGREELKVRPSPADPSVMNGAVACVWLIGRAQAIGQDPGFAKGRIPASSISSQSHAESVSECVASSEKRDDNEMETRGLASNIKHM